MCPWSRNGWRFPWRCSRRRFSLQQGWLHRRCQKMAWMALNLRENSYRSQGPERAGATIGSMVVEKNAPLQPWNTFGIAARAQTLVRVRSVSDLKAVLADMELAPAAKFVLGGGSTSPVQNIGAYGVELQDRFESLDALDLATGQSFSLDAAQCGFGYRDSV